MESKVKTAESQAPRGGRVFAAIQGIGLDSTLQARAGQRFTQFVRVSKSRTFKLNFLLSRSLGTTDVVPSFINKIHQHVMGTLEMLIILLQPMLLVWD